ncbi:unnamed protein product [Citrullus colocynthis]|uniref:Uncharacterized protein n=1 Tax=Citrullus colocynthis TaxID=252529 RepID=A0ABP0YY25_9ROSI
MIINLQADQPNSTVPSLPRFNCAVVIFRPSKNPFPSRVWIIRATTSLLSHVSFEFCPIQNGISIITAEFCPSRICLLGIPNPICWFFKFFSHSTDKGLASIMITIFKPFMTFIVIVHNLRVFGPGLNPFAPYCVAHHSFAVSR